MMEVFMEDYAKEEPDEFEYLYHTIETIASGSFGTVIKAIDLRTQKEVAVKIILKDQHSSQTLKQIEQEVEILKQLNHKNIVSFDSFMETKHKMYIVMEYLGGGTLLNYLKSNYNNLNEDQAKSIISSLLSAVNYLHQRDICHRDIKPENIMLKEHNDISSIKLVDFGLSSQFFEHKEEFNFCGTLLYMAPEQIQNKTYSKGIDIWSIGIILFMLLNEGRHPLSNSKDDKDKYITKLKHSKIEVFNQCSKIAESLLMKLLERKPCFRYTAQNALDHPWITGRKFDPIPKTVFERLKEKEDKKKLLYLLYASLFSMQINGKTEDISNEYLDKIKETNHQAHCRFIRMREDAFCIKKNEEEKEKAAVVCFNPSRPISPYIPGCALYKLSKQSKQLMKKDISFKDKIDCFQNEFKYNTRKFNSNKNMSKNENSIINTSNTTKKTLIRTSKTDKGGFFYPLNRKNSLNVYNLNSKQIVKAHIKNLNATKKSTYIDEEDGRIAMTPMKERRKSTNNYLARLNSHQKKTNEPMTAQKIKHSSKVISKFPMLFPKIMR